MYDKFLKKENLNSNIDFFVVKQKEISNLKIILVNLLPKMSF